MKKRIFLIGIITIMLFCYEGCSKMQEKEKQTNKELSLKICEYEAEMYESAFATFRKKFPDVDLQVETYPMDGILNTVQQMNAEMMAGEGPDLLILSCYGTNDVYKMINAGAFSSLDEFINDDDTWKKQDYVSSVINAGKYAGSQYVVPLSFDTMVAVASKEGLQNVGVQIDSCKDTLSFMKSVAGLYDTDFKERIFADVAQVTTFPDMLNGQFLDYENKKMNVDENELQKACESYCQMYVEDSVEGGDFGEGGYFGFGKKIAQEEAYFYIGPNMYSLFASASAISASATPVLIPMRSDKGEILARVNRYAGIRANSLNKQNAYNMLRILMNQENQSALLKYNYSPVLKKVIVDEIDEYVDNIRKDGISMAEIGKLSPSFIKEYKSYLLEPNKCFFPNNISISKFMDCMKDYYTGITDYDTCIKKFEDYVKIYLSE